MSRWEMVRLGDVASFVNGFAFKPSDWGETGLPIIRIQNLTGSSKEINYYAGDYPARVEVNDGDILISWSASLGIYIWNQGKAVLNQHIFRVVFDKVAIDRVYFVYSVSRKINEMLSKTHGSTMKHIVKGEFENTLIPLPPLATQRAIAATLDQAAALIALRKQQIEKLDLLVKARFVEMFGEYEQKPDSFKKLKDVCKFIDYRGKTPEKSDCGIPLITAKNVRANAFSVEPREYIPIENYDCVMTRGIPMHNDVLFTTEAPLGNVCRIPPIYEKFCVGQRIITIQATPSLLTSEYLEQALLGKRFQESVLRRSTGSTVVGIRSKELVELPIPLPPLHLQRQFALFVEQVEHQKQTLKQAQAQLQLQYDALMQEYFG